MSAPPVPVIRRVVCVPADEIRRVKCDEGKPKCQRCITTGRKCDGYSPSPPAIDDTAAFSVALVSSPDGPYDALEKRTFDFFRTRTTPCMSGYFQDPVWDRYVLQLSQSEPAVRHAVNALGALHEERWLSRTSGNDGMDVSLKTSYPLKEYTKALRSLQRLLEADNVHMDMIIMCVLVLVHFESMRECYVPALLHADNAIKLLQSRQPYDARKVDLSLVRALTRLDIQGSIYIGDIVPGLPYYTESVDSSLPATFHDLTQARDIVITWISRLLHFMRTNADPHKFEDVGDVPLENVARSHALVQKFVDLEKLLWDYLHKPSTRLTIREQHGLAMLRCKVKMNRILAATSIYSEATMLDAFLDDFQDMLTIICHIIESDAADRRLFTVSLDEGLVYPLFYIAAHCRDSRIRHKALDQLKQLPESPNGIWHVEYFILCAETCIHFEESGCDKKSPQCHDIPEWRRIHSTYFDGWAAGKQQHNVTTTLRVRPNGMDGEWEDIIETVETGWNANVPADPQELSIRASIEFLG